MLPFGITDRHYESEFSAGVAHSHTKNSTYLVLKLDFYVNFWSSSSYAIEKLVLQRLTHVDTAINQLCEDPA
jgi:hypothetical protein